MEQLSNFTTLRVGGPARKIVHAHSEAELIEFVKVADKNKEQVLILGGGSNLLISDAGFAGTVIRVESKGSALDYDYSPASHCISFCNTIYDDRSICKLWYCNTNTWRLGTVIK